MLDGADGRLLLLGGVNGRYPPRFSAGADWNVPRCGERMLDGADGRLLLLGGVNGRYPLRSCAGADWNVPRCCAVPTLEGRLLLLGEVNGRYPPRFAAGAFCVVARGAVAIDGAVERLFGCVDGR